VTLTSNSTPKSNYRPEIDGLRALAVGAVIANHFDKNLLPSGYLGVDIFFVISGFVITSSLARNQAKNFGDFLLGFYGRRIKRLYPALLLVVAVAATAITLVDPNPGSSLLTGISAVFGFSNVYLYSRLTDYFAASADLNVFLHTWSLGVEEQFYFLFPFLVWLSGFSRADPSGSRRLAWMLIPTLLASALSFAFLYPHNQAQAYFLITNRFWELASGSLLFLAAGQGWINRWPSAGSLPVLAALIGVMFLPLKSAVPATFLCIGLTCLLLHGLRSDRLTSRLLSWRPLVYVGLISYSLYLWHWPVLAISRWTVGVHASTIPFQILLIFLLAWSSYSYVETKCRHSSWPSSRSLTLMLAALAALATAAWLTALGKGIHEYLFLGKRNQIQDRFTVLAGRSSEICNLFSDPAAAYQFTKRCGFAGNPDRPTIYLLGDSQIEQFAQPISAFASQKQYGFYGVWGNACPFPALQALDHKGNPSRRMLCLQGQEIAKATMLQNIKAGDIVFMGSYLTANFDPQNRLIVGDPEQVRRSYISQILATAETFHARGASVVIYLNGPRFPGLEGTIEGYCTPQWYKTQLDPDCAVSSAFLAARQNDFALLYQWADGKRRILWDGVDNSTCGPTVCQAAHYKDEAHFRPYYSNYIFNLFANGHPGLFAVPKPAPRAIQS
jgi:peptidoglycan/LPS O-acetylase OafA/YrhL